MGAHPQAPAGGHPGAVDRVPGLPAPKEQAQPLHLGLRHLVHLPGGRSRRRGSAGLGGDKAWLSQLCSLLSEEALPTLGHAPGGVWVMRQGAIRAVGRALAHAHVHARMRSRTPSAEFSARRPKAICQHCSLLRPSLWANVTWTAGDPAGCIHSGSYQVGGQARTLRPGACRP